jgi:hypothetical protein
MRYRHIKCKNPRRSMCKATVDSTMGQIRVKAVLTAIHAIEGPPIFLRTSYGGLGEAQEEGYERSELLINKDKRIKRTFFIENRFISKA